MCYPERIIRFTCKPGRSIKNHSFNEVKRIQKTDVYYTYCHIGLKKRRTKNLIDNIIKTCDNCEICIKNKSCTRFKYVVTSHLGSATYPFEIVCIDAVSASFG